MDAVGDQLSPGQAHVPRTLRQMERERSYGALELKVEGGHVVLMARDHHRKICGPQ
jgi:hypothetical protein